MCETGFSVSAVRDLAVAGRFVRRAGIGKFGMGGAEFTNPEGLFPPMLVEGGDGQTQGVGLFAMAHVALLRLGVMGRRVMFGRRVGGRMGRGSGIDVV